MISSLGLRYMYFLFYILCYLFVDDYWSFVAFYVFEINWNKHEDFVS